MNRPKKIETTTECKFNELDNWAVIPRGTTFDVSCWQGINGQLCPIVNGNPFVNDMIYFKNSEWKPLSTVVQNRAD